VEVGWGNLETDNELPEQITMLLIGGNVEIKVVILVKLMKHANNGVTGTLEVYKNDRQGVPIRTQIETIFPAPPGNPPSATQHSTS
jgi:hypothetical protein